MEMYLCMKRTLNLANLCKKRYKDSRSKIAEAGKAIQDATQLAEENATKITELNAKLAEGEKKAIEAEEARVVVEAVATEAMQVHVTELVRAKTRDVANFRSLDEFIMLVDKEVMDWCEYFMYQVKRYNAGQKLNLNFLLDQSSLPKVLLKTWWMRIKEKMPTPTSTPKPMMQLVMINSHRLEPILPMLSSLLLYFLLLCCTSGNADQGKFCKKL